MTGLALPAGGIRPLASSRSRVAVQLAWTQEVIAVVLVAFTVVMVALAGPQDPVQPTGWPRVAGPISFLELATVGLLVALRRARNPIGWILCGVAFDGLVGEFAKQYANVGLARGHGSLPAIDAMAWVACLSATSTVFPLLTFGFLLFPDGRLPSRRWRPLAWLAAVAMVTVTVTVALVPGPLALEFPSVRNPFGVESAPRGVFHVGGIAFGLVLACVLGSVASMFVRLRRASGEERQQLKCVTYAASLVGIETVVSILWFPVPDIQPGSIEGPVFGTIFAVAFAVAIFKYRLYDIDVVISKTVVFGALAVFITIVYVAVVVGLGTVVGAQGGPSLVLSVLGAAVVAAFFQPVRERVERLANSLVYGRRATPYEVLARFSERMAATYPSEELLAGMARLLAEGTGTAGGEVWLRSGDRLRRVAGWPGGGPRPERRVLPASERPGRRGTRSVLVRHHGEVLGALMVQTRPGSPLSPPEERLLADLAGQAGLVLRNVRLIEDLRASRERLVTAQDAERRRLQRDIRERVERRLEAVAATLSSVQPNTEPDDGRVVTQLRAETAGAMTELRDLARGVYPPLLASEGLAAALAAHTHAVPLPVTIRADGVGRHPQDVEAAAYFCCLEALQNVAKHARAGRVVVTLSQHAGRIKFNVDDDGVGFDPAATTRGSGLQNMADRAEALGGSVRVCSTPGGGTVVAGWLPASTVEPVS